MSLLEFVVPKSVLQRLNALPAPLDARRADGAHKAMSKGGARIKRAVVDRYQPQLWSTHKDLCQKRAQRESCRKNLQAAEARRANLLRSFQHRALGALPLGALALEINELSQAGLASAHASVVGITSGALAALLAIFSAVALKGAAQAKSDKVMLQARLGELEEVFAQESRAAASRTLHALHNRDHAPDAFDNDKTRAQPHLPAQIARTHKTTRGAVPTAFANMVTPPPGWSPKRQASPKPELTAHDDKLGAAF